MVQDKICLGWRKSCYFCTTTTSQIIGEAAASLAAPLSAPMVLVMIGPAIIAPLQDLMSCNKF